MNKKESSHFFNINKIKKTVIKGVAPVIITPVVAIGIHESIVDATNDYAIVTPQAQHRIYNETLDQKYAQIVWDSKHAISQQKPEKNTNLKISPDQLSLGTKIAVALGLLSLLSYSVARSSEFAKYADTHQKCLMWAGVGLQAAASLAIIVETFK